MLNAKGDGDADDINFGWWMEEDGNEEETESEIAASYVKALFHRIGWIDIDVLTNGDTYVDLEDDSPHIWRMQSQTCA